MFASRGFFSGVPCPNEQPCSLPRCIFKHLDLEKQGQNPVETRKSRQSSYIADPEASDNDRVKRRKVSLENETSITQKTTSVEVNHAPSRAPSIKLPESSTAPAKSLQTATRQVSPPPLRRNRESINPVSASKTSSSVNNKAQVKQASLSTKPTTTGNSSGIKTLKDKPERKEALNPRALKSAPASHTLRFQLVKALHDQFVRLNSELAKDANDVEQSLVLSDQALINRVLDIEEEAASKPSIYSNVVKNNILSYKRMTVSKWKEEREKELEALRALNSSNSRAAKPVNPPKPIETGLTPEEELVLLPRLFTPIEGLSKHGYVSSVPSDDDINTAKRGVEASKGWEVCDRCKSRFQVFPGRREEDGALTSGGPCKYHFGKAFMSERSKTDLKAKREKRYRCCGQAVGDSPGCTQSDSHVFKVTEVKRLAAVMNFEKTPENTELKNKKPVCIDAEMGYTTYGLELIRLTATSWDTGSELLDVLVRPLGEILDLNSRYSGVWPKDMAEAKPLDASSKGESQTSEDTGKLPIVESPIAARALLFSYLSPQTPLIGHGLENDLNSTRIIHPTIIDTALLFPHKAGLPFRNGLKMLMQTHLNRDIQVVVEGNLTGHDSKEDANAARDLVRFALGKEWEKLKIRGWKFKNGNLIPSEQGVVQPNGVDSLSTGVPAKEQAVSLAPGGTRKRSRVEMEESLEEGEVGNK
ncbi:RNA exonuclease-like protein Rex3 [Xylogone sp. PMI_703]|nr:RNA exonuclease-like protein Rex3 [Xylogone sp. PMI_703]